MLRGLSASAVSLKTHKSLHALGLGSRAYPTVNFGVNRIKIVVVLRARVRTNTNHQSPFEQR